MKMRRFLGRVGVAMLVMSSAIVLGQQGQGGQPPPGQGPKQAMLPPLIASILEYEGFLRNMAMEKGTSASAASESRNGKSRSYKRSEDDGKATEEGAPDLRKNTDEMQEEAEKLRETAPLTIEVTVGEKSCKVVVQKGKLLSSEGDKDLMTQYELDYEGKLRDMATGAAAPGYRFRVSFSAFKNTTKTSKDPAGGGKGPTPQKKGGEK